MKPIGCYFGRHKPVLVAVNTEYHTTYTDTDRKVYHMLRFYQCEHCGHRSFATNYDGYSRHTGIDNAKANWLDTGVVPSNSYDPRKTSNSYVPEPPKPTTKKPDAEVIPFKVMKGGKNE